MSLNVNLLDDVVYVITNEDEIVYVTTLPNDIGQQSIQFQDEGINVGSPGSVNTIDFVGSTVSLSVIGGKLTVTITGGSGSAAWGSITGTITNQTDLINFLVANYQPLSAILTTLSGLTFSTDGTLSANSDSVLSSQKALKTYIDNSVTGLLDLKGSTDCSANPNYPSALKGDSYYVTVAGKIGGASGKSVDVGDVYVASADNAGGTEASVGTSWFVLEHNLTGALLSANNLSDLASAATARTNLGLGTLATQSGTFTDKQNLVNSATALVDGATIDLTAIKHTLSTSLGRTFTISYTGDDITLIITLSATSATFTFPATTLCVTNGTASGDNTMAFTGVVSGDKLVIAIKKVGSDYYAIGKNFGQ